MTGGDNSLDQFRVWRRGNPATPGLPTLHDADWWRQHASRAQVEVAVYERKRDRAPVVPALREPGIAAEQTPWGIIVRRFIDRRPAATRLGAALASVMRSQPGEPDLSAPAGNPPHVDDHVIVFRPPPQGVELTPHQQRTARITRRRISDPQWSQRLVNARAAVGIVGGTAAGMVAAGIGLPPIEAMVAGAGAGYSVGVYGRLTAFGQGRSRLVQIGHRDSDDPGHDNETRHKFGELITIVQFYLAHRDILPNADQLIRIGWETAWGWAGLSPELAADGDELDQTHAAILRQLSAASALLEEISRREELLRDAERSNARQLQQARLQRALEDQPNAATIDQITEQVEVDTRAHRAVTDRLSIHDSDSDLS